MLQENPTNNTIGISFTRVTGCSSNMTDKIKTRHGVIVNPLYLLMQCFYKAYITLNSFSKTEVDLELRLIQPISLPRTSQTITSDLNPGVTFIPDLGTF